MSTISKLFSCGFCFPHRATRQQASPNEVPLQTNPSSPSTNPVTAVAQQALQAKAPEKVKPQDKIVAALVATITDKGAALPPAPPKQKPAPANDDSSNDEDREAFAQLRAELEKIAVIRDPLGVPVFGDNLSEAANPPDKSIQTEEGATKDATDQNMILASLC